MIINKLFINRITVLLFFCLFCNLVAENTTAKTGAISIAQNQPMKFRPFRDSGNALKILLSDFWYITKSPLRINKKAGLILGSVASGAALLYLLDEDITRALHRNRDSKVYRSVKQWGENFERVGHMGVTNKYYAAAMVTGYIFRSRKITKVSAQILESHIIAGAFKNLANMVFGRYRPFEGKGSRFFKFNDGTSFPSGHASTIFQLATILSHHVNQKTFSAFAYATAGAVSFQRIASDNHWASDVCLAAIYGYAVSKTIIKLDLQRNQKFIIVPDVSLNGSGLSLIMHLN